MTTSLMEAMKKGYMDKEAEFFEFRLQCQQREDCEGCEFVLMCDYSPFCKPSMNCLYCQEVLFCKNVRRSFMNCRLSCDRSLDSCSTCYCTFICEDSILFGDEPF